MLSSKKYSETTRTRCKALRWKSRNWVTACCLKRQSKMKSRCSNTHGRTTLDRKCLTWRCLTKKSCDFWKTLSNISRVSSFSSKLSRRCKLREKTLTWALARRPLMWSKASLTLSSIQGSTSLTDQELLTVNVLATKDRIVAKQETFWPKLFTSHASYSNIRARNAYWWTRWTSKPLHWSKLKNSLKAWLWSILTKSSMTSRTTSCISQLLRQMIMTSQIRYPLSVKNLLKDMLRCVSRSVDKELLTLHSKESIVRHQLRAQISQTVSTIVVVEPLRVQLRKVWMLYVVKLCKVLRMASNS